MKHIVVLLFAVAAVFIIGALTDPGAGRADEESAPIFGITIPPGYRDWKLISVAYEEGDLNDLRAVLGNDLAVTAYRNGKLPFPDGAIIARLAWSWSLTSSAVVLEAYGQSHSSLNFKSNSMRICQARGCVSSVCRPVAFSSARTSTVTSML